MADCNDPTGPAPSPKLPLVIRRRLFEASGVVYAVRFALDNSEGNLDEVLLASALEGAGKILDDVAALLEGTDHE